ncbi:MAG: response regulator [Phycisphaerae bacterium]
MTKSTATGALVKTIRLDTAALDAILDRLDNIGEKGDKSRRASERYSYRIKSCVVHVQQTEGASFTPYRIAMREIGSSGASFLHGGFVHRGSKCVVALINTHGAWQEISGAVVRCRYLEQGVHEISVKFDSDIQVTDYCRDALKSRVLLADDDPSIVRLTVFLLNQLHAEVEHAENGQVAVEKALNGTFDAILMDMDMPLLDGFEATRQLRAKSYRGVIVALTSLGRPADRQRCLDAGCDQVLGKPAGRKEFARLLDMLRQEPLLSAYHTDPAMADIISAFVGELGAKLRAIEGAFTASDLPTLQRLARNLKGEAGGYGFNPITAAAEKVEAAIINKAPNDKVTDAVDELAHLCLRARSPVNATQPPDDATSDDEAKPEPTK